MVNAQSSRWFKLHCKGNSVYIFLFWELRGLSPNFYIHVSVSDLYIPRIGSHISSSRNGSSIVGIYKSLKDTWMWKLGLSPDIPFLGIFASNFRHFFFAVYHTRSCSISSYSPYNHEVDAVQSWLQYPSWDPWWHGVMKADYPDLLLEETVMILQTSSSHRGSAIFFCCRGGFTLTKLPNEEAIGRWVHSKWFL